MQDAFKEGFRRGRAFAEDNVPELGDPIDRTADWIGLGKVVTVDNVRDYHTCLAHEAERHARQYSPFEETAAGLNAFGDGGWWVPDEEGDRGPFDDRDLAERLAQACGVEAEHRPSAEEAWDAFEHGIEEGVADTVRSLALADYGYVPGGWRAVEGDGEAEARA